MSLIWSSDTLQKSVRLAEAGRLLNELRKAYQSLPAEHKSAVKDELLQVEQAKVSA
jgi:hypothetical protein